VFVIICLGEKGISDIIGPFDTEREAQLYIHSKNCPNDIAHVLISKVKPLDWYKKYEFPRLVKEEIDETGKTAT